MTFPSVDVILDSAGHNDSIRNATGRPRNSPFSTTTTTVPSLSSRRSQTFNKSPRSRKVSMPSSVGSGSEGMTAGKGSDIPKEFCIPVELYLSSKSPVGPRKPTRNKSVDGRLKDKSSWLSLSNRSPGCAQWRPATCKLSEEEGGCQLNIYTEETFLYQSLYIYLLKATDIRPADRSLFDKKDVLAIHIVPGQRYVTVPTNEPVYIAFSNTENMCTWLTLLRSYAVPEVYGTTINPSEGGLYRMWRQVEVHCISARDLGQTKHLPDPRVPETKSPQTVAQDLSVSLHASDSNGSWTSGTSDGSVDWDVWCEIWVGAVLCARTTVKKGTDTPEWHESFVIGDLPPYDNLQITLYKEKRGSARSVTIGSVVVSLGSFQRGEYMEGWNPIVGANANVSAGSGFYSQVGEMRLKLKVDEEIVLPHYVYSGVLQMLKSRNYLDWMNDLGTRLNLRDVSIQFISVAIATNSLVESICEAANKEVSETPTISHNTLFRGNTVLTKTIELFMAWYGKPFLESSIGRVIRRICIEQVSIEVDPFKNPKPNRDVERNVDVLVQWCQELWESIYRSRSECPPEMRRLFEHIRKLVEKRCRAIKTQGDDGSQNDLPWQAVSAFIFLRFIVPGILHPHLFALVPGLPEAPVQRSLTLIAKVLQSSANLNSQPSQKEQFMQGVQDFLVNNRQAMIDYILVISTSAPDRFPTPGSPCGPDSDRRERLQAIESLRFRGANMPLLNREAIPLLPHLLDVPRHLAVISSAIVRRSNEVLAKNQPNGTPMDPDLDEFVNKCLEVEQQALKRVGKLAAHTREVRRQRAATGSAVVNASSSLQTNGIIRPSTSDDSYTTAICQQLSTSTSSATQRSKSSLKPGRRPSTATNHTDTRQNFGSASSRRRPSTMQEKGNPHEITPLRPRSAGRALSSPSTPIKGKETFTPRSPKAPNQPSDRENAKTSPKFLRPILKRPSTAPSPSLVPMLPPTPEEVPLVPPLSSRSVSRATGWKITSIVTTPKKDKEGKKWLSRFSADDSTRRYPPGPENPISPGGEKRKGFSLRAFLSWK